LAQEIKMYTRAISGEREREREREGEGVKGVSKGI
jgi:hypothetical protein